MIMSGTHFKGPVYSKGGFAGQIDNTTGAISTGPIFLRPSPVTVATAGPATYTAAQIMNGTILRDTGGANRTDVLPTAALLVAGLNSVGVSTVYNANANVGTELSVTIYNTSAGAFTFKITMGTGGTSGTANTLLSVAQNASRTYRILITNATPGSEAYTVYS
jgi:hypothetical protein